MVVPTSARLFGLANTFITTDITLRQELRTDIIQEGIGTQHINFGSIVSTTSTTHLKAALLQLDCHITYPTSKGKYDEHTAYCRREEFIHLGLH